MALINFLALPYKALCMILVSRAMTSGAGSRISEKGELLMDKEGEGTGGGTPPAQLGGLGERCKLPHRGLGWSPRR